VVRDGRSMTLLPQLGMTELELAWASTVHKAQGSEGRAVVVTLPSPGHSSRMLYRKLLYTAASRARDVLIIVATRDALAHATRNEQRNEGGFSRMDLLTSRIRRQGQEQS